MGEYADVSVVIPCYRCADTIHRAVQSVYEQTLRPAEVILVEDCSGDQTLDALLALQAEYSEGWIKIIALERNGGPGEARNVGWEQASSYYLAFLDADDSWHHRKIEIQYLWMRRHPEAALTGYSCKVIYGDVVVGSNIVMGAVDEAGFKKIEASKLLLSNRFPTPSVMLKRELPYRFALGKHRSEDYLLWCEICLDGELCYKNELPLVYLYKDSYGATGLSGDLHLMQLGELDTYYRLRKSGRINWAAAYLLLGWSYVRHIRRIILVYLRKLMCK